MGENQADEVEVPLAPAQSGCRHEGWLLGREDVCVQVQTGQNAVQVLLESGP